MNFHASPSGRPHLFTVMADAARDVGDAETVRAAERAAELWHRAPEEWELERATREHEVMEFIRSLTSILKPMTNAERERAASRLVECGYLSRAAALGILLDARMLMMEFDSIRNGMERASQFRIPNTD